MTVIASSPIRVGSSSWNEGDAELGERRGVGRLETPERLAWLVDQHIRPLYNGAVSLLEPLVAAGKVRDVPTAHIYYLLTGAAATIFVLAPECRLLTGVDPVDPSEVERHVDAVTSMLFVS